MKGILLSLAILLLLPSVVSATTYYVSESSGNDASGDGSFTAPWRTLTKVENTAFSSGDKVFLLCGDTWLRTEWDWDGDVQIDWPNAVVGAYYNDAGTPREVDGVTHNCPETLPTIDGEITDFSGAVQWPRTFSVYTSGRGATIQDIQMQNYNYGIFVTASACNGTIQRCVISNIGQAAIVLYDEEWLGDNINNWTIDSNTISQTQQYHCDDDGGFGGGIVLRHADNNKVTRNIVRSGCGEGIDSWTDADDNEIAYNLVYDHSNHGIYVSTSDNVLVHHNFVINTVNTDLFFGRRGNCLGIGFENDLKGASESSNCTFSYNVVAGCRGGFTVTDPEDDDDSSTSTNYIYGNTFIDNQWNLWLYPNDDGELDLTFANNLFVINDVDNFDHTTGNSLSGHNYKFNGNGWDSSETDSIGNDFKNTTYDVIGDPAISKSDSWWDELDATVINAGDAALTSSSEMINVAQTLDDAFQRMGLDATTTWPDSVSTLNQNEHGDGWEFGAYVYQEGCIEDWTCTNWVCSPCVDGQQDCTRTCTDQENCGTTIDKPPESETRSCGTTGELVAHWTFDSDDISGGVVQDKSGFGNDGTIHGAVQVTGRVDEALYLDGDGYIAVSDSGNSPPDITENITLSAWVRFNNSVNGDPNLGYVIAKGQYFGWNPYRLVMYDNGVAAMALNNGSSQWTGYNGNYNDSKWHHVVGVYEHDSKIRLYVDGEEVSSKSVTGEIITDNSNLEIGGWGSGSYRMINGTIDEVMIWNRSLSAQEILDLYNSFFHPADDNPRDGCVEEHELIPAIDLWKYDSTANPMGEVMEAVALWSRGIGCT